MDKPQTVNGLMRHLRKECHIQISGSLQKQQLISYGYYHGYKGYRFFKNTSTPIPYTDFSQIVAVIEYDSNLKSMLYPHLMFLETSLKNIICNESVQGLSNPTFDCLFQNRMNDNTTDTALQLKRLQLKNIIYSTISKQYRSEERKENKMIRHFYNRGEDAPVWSIFEIIFLSDLATFYDCLNMNIREKILNGLNMLDTSIDTNRTILSTSIYTLKSLRNAVAHNNIIFDTRFKDRNINKALKMWLEKETGINNITLYSLVDYLILISCLLKRLDFSKKRALNLIEQFEMYNKKLKNDLPVEICDVILYHNTDVKISLLKKYLKSK